MNNQKYTEEKKPAQGGLHGVLGYIQTAGNLAKGDAIAPQKVDPFIRLRSEYNKSIFLFQITRPNAKNKFSFLRGEGKSDQA